MAIEKILNTRIQLKYDSFANWSSKNPTLKAGEVAIAYLTTAGAMSPSETDTQHPVLFKVGPGNFNDLPWVSALAADVHGWAKKSEADFKAWVKNLIEVTDIDAYSKAEVDNLLSANSTADQAHADSVAATAKSEAIAAAASDAQSKVDALKNGEVKANADAIDAIKDHDSVDSFADVMTEMAKYQLAGDYATKAEAQAMADAKDSAIAEAKKAGTDAAAALEAYKTSNDAAVALKASDADLAAEIARAKAAEKANSDAIALLVDSTEDGTKLNSIKELATWIEEHGGEAAEMAEAINKNKTDIANEVSRASNEEARLAGLIADNADAIAALNAEDGKVANAERADEASSLDEEGIAQVQGIKVNNAGHADSADNATNAEKAADADKLGGVAAADYATKTYVDQAESDANAYADSLAVNYATAAQGAKADSALQEITTTANGGLKVTNKNHIDIDPEVVFVFNCGSASTLVD